MQNQISVLLPKKEILSEKWLSTTKSILMANIHSDVAPGKKVDSRTPFNAVKIR